MTKCGPSLQLKYVKIPVKTFPFDVTLRLIIFETIFIFSRTSVFTAGKTKLWMFSSLL